MTKRPWKIASDIAIALLLALTAVALFLTWFQVDDCAEAMRRTDRFSELHRSIVPRCAAYREQYTSMKWLSLLALVAAGLLWWLPRRGGTAT